jgi:hypothetical protein
MRSSRATERERQMTDSESTHGPGWVDSGHEAVRFEWAPRFRIRSAAEAGRDRVTKENAVD